MPPPTPQQRTAFTLEVWEVLTGADGRSFTQFVQDEVSSNPLHVIVEVLCVVYIVYLWMLKPYRPGTKPRGEEPTEAEKAELIKGWKPEPIAEVDLPDEYAVPDEEPRTVTGQDQTHLTVEGVKLLDLGTFNYLRLSVHPEVVQASLDAIDHYGVGSCGPRGFYGTVQPHLVLEEHLRRVFQTEGAIIYSFQYSTTSSIIPAFAGREDVLVVDKGVNMSLLNGVYLSRSKVLWFEHNDLVDLEKQLATVAKQQKGKKPTRRWIVVEGVYRNHGDICPLAKIMELKRKYKFRIVVDDSYGLGLHVKAPGGTTSLLSPEERKNVDVLTGALDTTLGSTGGFCVGSDPIVDHQRLSSAGYCFSASLPPFSAVAASTALRLMQDDPKLTGRVQDNVQAMQGVLKAAAGEKKIGLGHSHPSPIFHCRFPEGSSVPRPAQERALSAAVKELQGDPHRILVVRPQYTKDEKWPPPASIRVVVSSGPSTQQIIAAGKAIVSVLTKHIQHAQK
eukprot:TRINITY_DN12239_c0_g1_i1.p1 TRINITY_DN12239_c0_g1~~TRINITY_DN12239_c0_g1_i1.p1  ORF type:complete len:538 (+),score=200.10 TRINITY_DN12239_c0_g1_i1:103-1614(+)